jgi:hypothetical protein
MKYYEKYADLQNYSIESQVKLAHVYSKLAHYNKKSLDMLSEILFVGKSSFEFREFKA